MEEQSSSDETDSGRGVYSCPDTACQKQYVKSANLEKHLALGNHSYKKAVESGIDSGVRIWAERCSSIRQKYCNIMENVTPQNQKGTSPTSKGWALKSITRSSRFSPKVKDYVLNIFNSCEKSGKRPNYSSLSEELKKSCHEDGSRMFAPSDWLTPNQLRGIFASYLMKSKKKIEVKKQKTDDFLKEVENVEEDEHLQEVLMNLKAEEHEQSVSTMFENVYNSVNME